jgi:hypothetical protein
MSDAPNSLRQDQLDLPIWGAKRIGQEANVTERQAYHLLRIGALDATKVGHQHVSTPRRIRRSLGIKC